MKFLIIEDVCSVKTHYPLSTMLKLMHHYQRGLNGRHISVVGQKSILDIRIGTKYPAVTNENICMLMLAILITMYNCAAQDRRATCYKT